MKHTLAHEDLNVNVKVDVDIHPEKMVILLDQVKDVGITLILASALAHALKTVVGKL